MQLKPHLHVPRLALPRLPPGGSLGTPKNLSNGATLHLGPIRLHVENWECRALKSSAWCQKFGMPCRFFSVCKWGSSLISAALLGRSVGSFAEQLLVVEPNMQLFLQQCCNTAAKQCCAFTVHIQTC